MELWYLISSRGGGRVVRWSWVNFQYRGWGGGRWSGGAMVLGKLPIAGGGGGGVGWLVVLGLTAL